MSQGAPIAFDFQVRGDAEAKSKIQGIGGALSQLDAGATRAATSASVVERNYSQAALGMSAAAASGASLFFQFDNLEKVQLRADTATKNLTAAQATLASSQATLNNLTEKGITSGPQYEAAVLRLKSSQEQLAIASERVNIAQGDVSEAQAQFALSIVPTVFAGVGGITSSLKALGLTLDLTKIKTLFLGPPMLTLNGVLGGTAGAAGVATSALGALRTAMRFIAEHPIILPLTAVATVLTLVATNAFGVRDALDSFAKKVEEIFPVLKPVFDFFRTIAATLFPDTEAQALEMSDSVTQSFGSLTTTIDQGASAQSVALTTAGDNFAELRKKGTDEMNELANAVDDAVEAIKRDLESIKGNVNVTLPGTAPAIPASAAQPTTEQITRGENLAERAKELDAKIRTVQDKIDKMAGGMTFAQVEGQFKAGTRFGGSIMREFGELDKLRAEREAIRRQELAKMAVSVPRSTVTFDELLQQGKNLQFLRDPQLMGAITGVGGGKQRVTIELKDVIVVNEGGTVQKGTLEGMMELT